MEFPRPRPEGSGRGNDTRARSHFVVAIVVKLTARARPLVVGWLIQYEIGRTHAPARICLLFLLSDWQFARARSYFAAAIIAKITVRTRPLLAVYLVVKLAVCTRPLAFGCLVQWKNNNAFVAKLPLALQITFSAKS